jgi:hypothetical protein
MWRTTFAIAVGVLLDLARQLSVRSQIRTADDDVQTSQPHRFGLPLKDSVPFDDGPVSTK